MGTSIIGRPLPFTFTPPPSIFLRSMHTLVQIWGPSLEKENCPLASTFFYAILIHASIFYVPVEFFLRVPAINIYIWCAKPVCNNIELLRTINTPFSEGKTDITIRSKVSFICHKGRFKKKWRHFTYVHTQKTRCKSYNDVVIETRKKNPLPVNIGIERSKEFKCTYKPKLKFLNVF